MRVMLMPCSASGSSSRYSAPGASVSAADTSSVVLSAPLGAERLAADHEEARGVVRAVLDLRHEHVQAVDLRGRGAGDRRGAALRRARGARPRRCSRRRRARRRAGARRSQPRHCASDCGCAQTRCDVAERRHAAHQVLVDAQLHLAADLQRRGQEHVERVVDRAFASSSRSARRRSRRCPTRLRGTLRRSTSAAARAPSGRSA